MARVSDMFPSTYLKAADLRGRAVPVTIRTVDQEELGGEQKYIVYFEGKDRGLVLNKTNANMIASSYGDETLKWTGCDVVLYPDKVPFQGRIVDAIRVRIPAAPEEVREPGSDESGAGEGDDIPF